ncbi:MAG: hypothetical protein ACYS8Z_04830 [Planctomycetota bacterium]|jgi:hypothetical protein
MEKRKQGKWRVVYRSNGVVERTRAMNKREAKYYYSIAQTNLKLGHWDKIAIVKADND